MGIGGEFEKNTNFDKEFLDSLPEGVSNDIAMELKENQKPDKKNLKLPSTQITLTETYKRWEQFLENEEAQKTERFGMNLFRSMKNIHKFRRYKIINF